MDEEAKRLVSFQKTGVFPASRVQAQDRLSADIASSAKLVEGGQALELKVKVRCFTSDFEVLESFAYASQAGNESDFGFFTPVCGENTRVQVFRVRIPVLDFTFQRGEASATVFILLENPETGETTQIQDQALIRIK